MTLRQADGARRLALAAAAAAGRGALTLLLVAVLIGVGAPSGLAEGPSPPGRGWALLVGVDRYASAGIPALRWCEADVDAMAEALTGPQGFDPARITVLKGPEASRQGVVDALSRFTDPKLISEDDDVIVYFSGHGQTVPIPRNGLMGFLLPYDAQIDLSDVTNPAQYYASCIAMSELRRISDLIPARHVLFLVDACYSGLAVESSRGVPHAAGAEALGAAPSRHILTAGMRGEQALEDSSLGHGVFTSVVLSALDGPVCDYNADGYVTAQELATYVQGAVPKLSNQTPQFCSFSGEGQYLLQPGSTGPRPTAAPRIEVSEPAELQTGDLRVQVDPTGGQVRFAGQIYVSCELQALTVDGAPARFQATEAAPAGATRAYAFEASVEVGMGEEKVVAFSARDVEGREGSLRIAVAAQARDVEAPEVEVVSLASVPSPQPVPPQRGRYITIAATARALPPAGLAIAREATASVGAGECLRLEGLARDAQAAVSVTLDGCPIDVQTATPEMSGQLGWEQSQAFDVIVAQPAGDHYLLVADPSGNTTCVRIRVRAATAVAPQIIVVQPAVERGTGLTLPRGQSDVAVVGFVRSGDPLAAISVGESECSFRPAEDDELRRAGTEGPAVRFEGKVPLPTDGSSVSITVRVTTATGQTTTQTFVVRRLPPAIQLEFASDKPSCVVGERVHFAMETDQAAWVYLYHLEPNGSLTLFLPNPVEPDNLLRAGVPRRFPASTEELRYGTSYGLFAQEPLGTDTAYCLVLQQPLSAAAIAAVASIDDLAAAVDASGRARGLRLELPKSPTPEELTEAAEVLEGALRIVRYEVRAR